MAHIPDSDGHLVHVYGKPKPFDPLIVCRKCKRPVERLVAVVRRGDGGYIKVRCHGEDGEVPLDMAKPDPIGAAFLCGQAFKEE